MSFGQTWVIEIVRCAAAHAQRFHHPPRAFVGRHGHRHDLVQAQRFEPMVQNRARTFACEAVTPRVVRESPTDLDRRREVRVERNLLEPDEPDEGVTAHDLDRPETEPMRREVRFDARGPVVAFGAAEWNEMLHHARIRVERSEGRAIALAPAAEQQSFGAKLGDHV